MSRKQYCCMKCYAHAEGKYQLEKIDQEIVKKNKQNIKNYAGWKRDGFTPYRYFMKCISNKNRMPKVVDLDAKYLQELWEKQKGICPLTGWELELPISIRGFKGNKNPKRASLDRIDNSKGYLKGNVRFISVMANYALNTMSDDDLVSFCNAVVNFQKIVRFSTHPPNQLDI